MGRYRDHRGVGTFIAGMIYISHEEVVGLPIDKRILRIGLHALDKLRVYPLEGATGGLGLIHVACLHSVAGAALPAPTDRGGAVTGCANDRNGRSWRSHVRYRRDSLGRHWPLHIEGVEGPSSVLVRRAYRDGEVGVHAP